MIINNPDWDTLIFRAEAYGRYHQAESPGMDRPLSGQFAGTDAVRILAQNIGADASALSLDDLDVILEAFESAYSEQDTDETGWKFPRCVCPVWTHDLDVFERIASSAQCPAHDGDAWNEYVNTISPEQIVIESHRVLFDCVECVDDAETLAHVRNIVHHPDRPAPGAIEFTPTGNPKTDAAYLYVLA